MSNNETKLTFSEFKMWLQGVEEMQDEGWTPSPVQWKRIKEKLMLVTEKVQKQSIPPEQEYRPAYYHEEQRPIPQVSRAAPPINENQPVLDSEAFAKVAIPKDVGPVYKTPFK